jgi:hypothetical protein
VTGSRCCGELRCSSGGDWMSDRRVGTHRASARHLVGEVPRHTGLARACAVARRGAVAARAASPWHGQWGLELVLPRAAGDRSGGVPAVRGRSSLPSVGSASVGQRSGSPSSCDLHASARPCDGLARGVVVPPACLRRHPARLSAHVASIVVGCSSRPDGLPYPDMPPPARRVRAAWGVRSGASVPRVSGDVRRRGACRHARGAHRGSGGQPAASAWARSLRNSADVYRSLASAGWSSFCFTQPTRMRSAVRAPCWSAVGRTSRAAGAGEEIGRRTNVTEAPTRTFDVVNPGQPERSPFQNAAWS